MLTWTILFYASSNLCVNCCNLFSISCTSAWAFFLNASGSSSTYLVLGPSLLAAAAASTFWGSSFFVLESICSSFFSSSCSVISGPNCVKSTREYPNLVYTVTIERKHDNSQNNSSHYHLPILLPSISYSSWSNSSICESTSSLSSFF